VRVLLLDHHSRLIRQHLEVGVGGAGLRVVGWVVAAWCGVVGGGNNARGGVLSVGGGLGNWHWLLVLGRSVVIEAHGGASVCGVVRRTHVIAVSVAVGSSGSNDGQSDSLFVVREWLLDIVVLLLVEETTTLAAGSVVVVRAGAVGGLLLVVAPHGELHEESNSHETGTTNGTGERGGVELGCETEVGASSAGGARLTSADRCVDSASATTTTGTVKNGDGDKGSTDQSISEKTEDGSKGLSTEAADHEHGETSVDDCDTSHTLNCLPVLGDALERC